MDKKDFLKDIGLDYWGRRLKEMDQNNDQSIPSNPPPLVNHPILNNIVPFFSKTSMKMDCPITATLVHINNLIETYGKDAVLRATEEVVKE